MCEPAHSVIQYPDSTPDDDQTPFAGSLGWKQRLQTSLGSLGTRIANWFHYSKLGNGHSEAIQLSGKSHLLLPRHTKYEGFWWDRSFSIDGPFHGTIIDKVAALQSAESYHNLSVMGSMGKFRNFLEQSMKASNSAHMYAIQFVERVLNQQGRDQFMQKIRQVFKMNSNAMYDLYRPFDVRMKSTQLDTAIKVLMGFTRKRKLLNSNWAEDDKLWIPG